MRFFSLIVIGLSIAMMALAQDARVKVENQEVPAAAQSKAQGKVVKPTDIPAVTQNQTPVCYELDGELDIVQTMICPKPGVANARHDCVQIKCPKAIANGGRNRCWRCGRS